jgi:hypothetical protein
MIDPTESPELQPEHEANDNAEQADRCRRLARATYDRATSAMLEQMADDFDQRSEQRSA